MFFKWFNELFTKYNKEEKKNHNSFNAFVYIYIIYYITIVDQRMASNKGIQTRSLF